MTVGLGVSVYGKVTAERVGAQNAEEIDRRSNGSLKKPEE